MECLPISYAPLILHSESEPNWTILSEQLHQATHKPSPSSPPMSTTTTTTAAIPHIIKHAPSTQHLRARRTAPNPLLLHIPTKPLATGAVQKMLTPTKNPRSISEWEALLQTSHTGLRGAYAKLSQQQVPPPAPKPAARAVRRMPDFSRMNRVQMASRAMQMAAGCGALRRPGSSSSSSSEGSDDGSEDEEMDAPATPVGVESGAMMDIDPRLFW